MCSQFEVLAYVSIKDVPKLLEQAFLDVCWSLAIFVDKLERLKELLAIIILHLQESEARAE